MDSSQVAVVTDSTAYLPTELVERYGIAVVSLYYQLGEGPRRREVDSNGEFGHFYAELEAAQEVALTSPPSVEDFTAVYEPLLAAGRNVVSIHISSGMSTTCEVARRASVGLASEVVDGQRVEVVDSAATGGHLAMVVLAAACAAAAGRGLEAVAERGRQARQEVKLWFLLDTLEYLRRGGRIGGAAAWVGSALKVKPILTLESEITAVERVRSRERGTERLIELARQRHAAGADAWFVQHARAADDAKRLAARLEDVFGRPAEFVSELGPVVGTHAGPGLVGFGGLPSRFLE